MIPILIFMDKRVLLCINLSQIFIEIFQKCQLIVWTKWQRTGQVRLLGFKQSSLTELHFAGFKSNFLVLDYWCFRKGKGTDGHKTSKSSLSLSTWAGRGQDTINQAYHPAMYFFIIRKIRPACIIHTEADEPQVFYITCALCLYLPRTLPCPHCALFSFLWFYSVKCLSSLFLNCRFRSKAEFTSSPSRTDLNGAGKLPFTGLLITVIELRFHASQRIITLLFISIPTH